MNHLVSIGGGLLLGYVLVVAGISIENATNTDGVTSFLVASVASIALLRTLVPPTISLPKKASPPTPVKKETTKSSTTEEEVV